MELILSLSLQNISTKDNSFKSHYELNDCEVVLNPDTLFLVPCLFNKKHAMDSIKIRGAETNSGHWVGSVNANYSTGGFGGPVKLCWEEDLLPSKEAVVKSGLEQIIHHYRNETDKTAIQLVNHAKKCLKNITH